MLKQIKRGVASMPIIGPALKRIYAGLLGRPVGGFERSDQYWEDRYRRGGTSGAGSYGRLAIFKADILNDLVKKNNILSVIEFGCGDSAQLQLSEYPRYVGFDVSKTAIAMCREKFANSPNYDFHLVGSEQYNSLSPAELALSVDVIYHLVEDDVFDTYMKKLFASSERYVVIYAYDFDRTYRAPHERGRNFTVWIEQNSPDWKLAQVVQNPYPYDSGDPDNTSQSDFFIFERHFTD